MQQLDYSYSLHAVHVCFRGAFFFSFVCLHGLALHKIHVGGLGFWTQIFLEYGSLEHRKQSEIGRRKYLDKAESALH